jgi:hypothetical protein
MATKMENTDRLNRKLAAMPPAAKKLMRASLDANAKELLEGQKALAAQHRRSGRTIEGLDIIPGPHELAVYVVNHYRPSRYEEFGTVKTPAIPFFFPPYRLLRKRFKTRTRTAVSKAVKGTIGVR